MTQREPGQDFDPKHRIIGAVVIVVLAVIFIPMILKEREPPAPRTDTQPAAATEPAGDADKVAVTTLTPPAPAPAFKEAESAKAASKPQTMAHETEPSGAKPNTARTATAAVKPQAKPTAATKRPDSGWVVQVGTFSNTANATRLERKLRAKGEPLLVEHIVLDGAKAVRLRVGPFNDRDAALRVQARISKEVGVKGVVLTYP